MQLFFPCGRYSIEPGFSDNRSNYDAFFERLDSISKKPGIRIESTVHIRSSASPEGGKRRNDFLSRKRAESLVSLYESRSFLGSDFDILSIGSDWDSYRALVSGSQMRGAEAQSLFYPLLRQANLTLYYSDLLPVPKQLEHRMPETGLLRVRDELALRPVSSVPPVAYSKPLLALKSNLLYDALTFVNLGVELPLGDRFSVGADVLFPWWRIPQKDITLQLLEGELSAKYWLGDRSGKEAMTGVFAGLYAGAGYYDFQLGRLTDGKGVQGDVFLLCGLQAGYAHKISSNLRLEYSLGFGYLRTDYCEYISVKDTKFGDIKVIPYPWQAKRTTGILPSKLSLSLVWMISSKKGGGR
ncbi:MAG: DUF3575 domain-containing protein [Candidatus Cryptobacteroides sp.]